MKKLALAVALASVVTLSFGTSHAGPRSATYVATGLYPTGVQTSGTPTASTSFAADGKVPIKIQVADAAGLKGFSVDVCQNLNTGNPNCAAGDASFSYCSTGAAVTIPSGLGFVANAVTVVYVNPDDATALVPCGGNTAAGTITLTT